MTYNAASQKAWRRAHPGYDKLRRARPGQVERERLLHRVWKRANPVLVARQRRLDKARHPHLPIDTTPLPTLHLGHALFTLARRIVADPRPMTLFQPVDELDREDARSEAVLASLEQRDPVEAVRRYLAHEAGIRRLSAVLFP